MATSASSQKVADFNGKRVLVTIRGWPNKLCPMTTDRLDGLLKQLQETERLVNYVVTLEAPLSDNSSDGGNYYCVSAPCLSSTSKDDINERRSVIVMDVTVWDNVTTSTRPLFIQSVQHAWEKFLRSMCTTSPDELDYVIQVKQAAIVQESLTSRHLLTGSPTHNFLYSMPPNVNGYSSTKTRSKSTDV